MNNYQELFREMPLPAVVLTHGRLREDCNQAFEHAFVRDGKDKLLFDALWGDIHDFECRGEKSGILERSVLFPEGEVKTFRVRLSKLHSQGGTGNVLALFTDITERRRHLEEISRLASIVDSSDDAIVSIAPNRKIHSWNTGAAKVFGYGGAAILHTSVMKLVPASAAGELASILDRVLAGESFLRREMICHHEDGHIFPASMTLSPLRDHSGIIGVTMVTQDISSRRYAEEQLLASHRQLQSLMHETVESLSMAHEKRDLYTAGHQRAVAVLGCFVADEMNLSSDQIECVRIAGLLHDIGKVCLPMAILSKPAALSAEEMALIRKHPEAGYEIVKNIPFRWPVKDIILQHHERIDGSGYPRGLHGVDICIEARILAVADVVEAMSSHRPYRPALGLGAAMEELKRHQGVRYDAEVCRVVGRLMESQALRIENGRLACWV